MKIQMGGTTIKGSELVNESRSRRNLFPSNTLVEFAKQTFSPIKPLWLYVTKTPTRKQIHEWWWVI
jgi:hypothetical protein